MEIKLTKTDTSMRPEITKLKLEEFINPTPKEEKWIRFVCISDTHTEADMITIPDGDVLLCSGDFTYTGQPTEVEKFRKFLISLPHKYKVVIAGNHDYAFDSEKYKKLRNHPRMRIHLPEDIEVFKNSFINGIEGLYYLENSSVNILGYEIYGSPFTPMFFNMAFMKKDEELLQIWQKIPENVDILLTHGPPRYIGDFTVSNVNAGSLTLLNEIQNRIKPKYHIFGHIHEGYGVYSDDYTTYINCAIMTVQYSPKNFPIVFDLPMK